MASLFLAPTANYIQTTLNGAITDSATTITLNSTTNLQAPGYVVINRVSSSGVATPNSREVVSYTGISGSDLTGCTRGADNSTNRSHSNGAIVETMPTVGMWNDLRNAFSNAFTADSVLKAIISPVSISDLRLIRTDWSSIASGPRLEVRSLAVGSIASVAALHIGTRIDVSAASLTGIGFYPTWHTGGSFSGPTIGIGGFLKAPRTGTLAWVSVVTRFVASGASIVFDVKKNGSSIFAGVTTPLIAAGGTYVSTASLNTKNVTKGDLLQADITGLAAGGMLVDVTVQGGTE